MPAERTLAILKTEVFLQTLTTSTEVPIAIQEQAKRLLRHFPQPQEIESVVEAMSQLDSPLYPPVFCIEDTYHPELKLFFRSKINHVY